MLILGSFIFNDIELPEKVPFGGEQTITVHKMLGGARVVDAMGPDEADIQWSGRFQSGDANIRARAVDAMRIAGVAVPLIVDDEYRTVIIKSFKWDYQRFYQIPYSITCLVVDSPENFDGVPDSLDVLFSADLSSVTSLLSSFADSVF